MYRHERLSDNLSLKPLRTVKQRYEHENNSERHTQTGTEMRKEGGSGREGHGAVVVVGVGGILYVVLTRETSVTVVRLLTSY